LRPQIDEETYRELVADLHSVGRGSERETESSDVEFLQPVALPTTPPSEPDPGDSKAAADCGVAAVLANGAPLGASGAQADGNDGRSRYVALRLLSTLFRITAYGSLIVAILCGSVAAYFGIASLWTAVEPGETISRSARGGAAFAELAIAIAGGGFSALLVAELIRLGIDIEANGRRSNLLLVRILEEQGRNSEVGVPPSGGPERKTG
jgi:hypothetical protein